MKMSQIEKKSENKFAFKCIKKIVSVKKNVIKVSFVCLECVDKLYSHKLCLIFSKNQNFYFFYKMKLEIFFFKMQKKEFSDDQRVCHHG